MQVKAIRKLEVESSLPCSALQEQERHLCRIVEEVSSKESYHDFSDLEYFLQPGTSKRKVKITEVQCNSSLMTIASDSSLIKESLKDITTVTATMSIPPAVLHLLIKSFKCLICHDVISPPVSYANSCQTI